MPALKLSRLIIRRKITPRMIAASLLGLMQAIVPQGRSSVGWGRAPD